MRKITLLFILFYTATNFAQKQIPGIQIQETNLLISAEVDSPTRVTFKFTPLGETKAVDTLVVTSFNNLTFKAMTLKHLKALKNSESEYFKSEIYRYSDQDIEKLDSIGSQNGLKALEKAKDNVDFLFNYFDNQINILYKYDTEPVAGVLHFKKDNIVIQHFENTAYEIYFNNMKRNYHKLIKELFEKRLDLVKNTTKSRSEIDNTLVTYIIDYFEKSRKDYLYEASQLNEDKNDTIMAKNFLNDFRPIIEDFRSYNRNKRMEIIYKKILSNRNQIILNENKNKIGEIIRLGKKVIDYTFLNNIENKIILIYKDVEKEENKYEIYQKKSKKVKFELEKFEQIKLDSLNEEIKKVKQDLEKFYETNEIKSDKGNSEINDKRKALRDSLDSNSDMEEIRKRELINQETQLRNKLLDLQNISSKTKENDFDLDKTIKKLKSKSKELDSIVNKIKNNIDLNLMNTITNLDIQYNEYIDKINYEIDKRYLSDSLILNSEKYEDKKEEVKSAIEKLPLWYFEPKEIQLDFNDGFVEHIVIEGYRDQAILSEENLKLLEEAGIKFPLQQLKFTNNYPLGFSSSKDFDDFKEHTVSVYVGKHKWYEMRLGDLFPNYIQTLQNDRLNFSPKDQAVTIYTDQDPTYRELKKESSSKLLQVKVYSDFVGLNSSDPNGTFQLELEKYIPIYTKRKSGLAYERYFGRGSNIGFFNYIKPEFRWSRPGDKDDNDKLELQSINAFNGSESITLPYATHLDLMRFESLSVGADLNIFVFDFPTAKWRMEVNASGRYGVTDVVNSDDTNVDDSNLTVNTWRFYPEFIFRLRPEERYGANLSLRPIRFNSVTDGFSNISSANAFTTTLMDDEQWLHQIEINAHFSPKGNKDNRFFFRYRYTNNASWEYNGFSEIQVGYSMSLKF